MADIFHLYGSDLSVSATGDILGVDSTTEGQQRVIRRLLTNPYDYIFNVAYGAGLGSFVGQPGKQTQIQAITKQNMYKESVVAQNPAPTIGLVNTPDGTYTLTVQYADFYGNTSALEVPVGEN